MLKESFKNKYLRVLFKLSVGLSFAVATYILRLLFFGSEDIQGLYLFFLIGVILSAWYSGFLYGLFTSFVSLVILNYFFLAPNTSFLIQDSKELFLSCVFIILSIVISFLAERMHLALKETENQQAKINEMKDDLQDSVEKIQILMDSIGDAFINVDAKSNIIYLNNEAEKLFNITKEEVISKSIWELMPNSVNTQFYDEFNKILQNNESTTFDQFFPDENKWLEIHTFPTTEISGVAIYIRDVTANKQREETMRQNEAYYKKFINSNVIGIKVINLNHDILDVNDAFLNIIGYTREDFEKGIVNWKDITPIEFQKRDIKQMEVLKLKGVTDTYEKYYIKKDGSFVPTLVAKLMVDEEKGIIMSYILDISERKQNEERLKESEQRFRHMADRAPGLIWMSDKDKNMTYLNKRWSEFRGKPAEEEYGKLWFDAVHEADRNRLIKKYNKAHSNIKEFEIEYRLERFDGIYRWFLGQGVPRFDSEGNFQGYIGISLDVTDRKEVQKQLKESKDQLQIIFQNVADAVTVTDHTGRTIYLNDKAAEMLEYPSANALIAEDEKKLIKELTAKYEARDETGRVLAPEEMPGARILKGERDIDMVFELHNKIENKGKWYLMKSRAILDDNKNLRLAVNVISDITYSKLREKQKDEFMSIASHELKTPITTIKAFTQILLQRSKKQNDNQNLNYLEKMDKQVNNLTNLVSDLLDVSRIQAGKMSLEKEVFDINELLNDTINNLQITHPSHKLIKQGEIKAEINADKRRIEQVLINLINNAVKYSPNGDKVEINIEKVVDKNVNISIKDYGIGINKNDQKKIFKRFYVSEENRENRFFGLGLGLFISSEIIKRHKGEINVESTKGKGSTFTISLPLAKKD